MSAGIKWERFAPLPVDIQRNLQKLPSFFRETDVLLVYLFGSFVEKGAGRDIDLAVLAEKTAPYTLRVGLTAVLQTERLDIVDLRRASPAFRFEIIRCGRLIYAADPDLQLPFELKVVREYHDTAYRRKQQEKLLKRRMAAWSSNAAAS